MTKNALKKLIFFVVLLIGFTGCVQTKYFVKMETALSKLDLDKSLVIYIPVADSDVFSSAILDSSYRLLQRKQFDHLSHYLKTLHSETSDYYLSKTLLYMAQTKYREASEYLHRIDDGQYQLTKQLLTIDLRYELSRTAGSNDFSLLLHEYQTLIDTYPNNESLRKIISLRIRYIRYNY